MTPDAIDPVPARPVFRLADYTPPPWLVERIVLRVSLHPTDTRVHAEIEFRANPAVPRADLRLDGRGLGFVSAAIDGETLVEGEIDRDAEGLTVPAARLPAAAFTWSAETRIDPQANTTLEGLYLSNGIFCTQCEAQGFRKITWYPDRPDVMAPFTVRIEADRASHPVLLSNGDPVEAGPMPAGRHYAVWQDPHPKPSYLFALVAGDLRESRGAFTTASGRPVRLGIWVRPGDEGKTAYAMDALIRSMRWDEERYGCEYDLDVFNIVAIDDFNMGAMENKGLNIFNAKYVLASPETATDADYERIESIIAHEYFHNWTGNRITCRDWFQLCLKEGLTVFRDQQFTADMRSEPVKRIEDVRLLRARQFREDDGPLAHPVRPEQYSEINNFYTATVYEKGAEVIRMLETLVGSEGYRKALDLYLSRHDGEATTVEAFRACFEEATGRDLSQFALWWSQSGTPRLVVEEAWDAGTGRYALTFRQSTPPTPGQARKQPLVIPVALGLLGPNGADMLPETTRVVAVDSAETTVSFEGLPHRPVPSLLRGFSAPVRLIRDTSDAERAFLLAHDSDPFNRWDAGRSFALDVTLRMLDGAEADPALLDGLGAVMRDESLDPAFRALALDLPGEEDVAREIAARDRPADPEAILQTVRSLRRAFAARFEGELGRLHDAMAVPGPYSPDAAAAGRRALRNRALGLLAALGTPDVFTRAEAQFRQADNMSEQAPALAALVHHAAPQADTALAAFRAQWRDDVQVMDKWFAVQATAPRPDALARVRALAEAPDFPWRNPNRFRALIGAFAAGNPSQFHASDGSGYAFVVDWLIRLDPVNPQTAARLAGSFETWARYDVPRQRLMRGQLERLAAAPGLSRDTADIVARLLDG
jgi:aminopeptidase N